MVSSTILAPTWPPRTRTPPLTPSAPGLRPRAKHLDQHALFEKRHQLLLALHERNHVLLGELGNRLRGMRKVTEVDRHKIAALQ